MYKKKNRLKKEDHQISSFYRVISLGHPSPALTDVLLMDRVINFLPVEAQEVVLWCLVSVST